MTLLSRVLERFAEPSLSRPFAARANVLLPGLYAWAMTVAVPVTALRAPGAARVTAVLALAQLVLGPLIFPARPWIGRILGIHVFVALCVGTWGLLVRSGLPLAAEPMHATFGALGWMLYAFGWGELRDLGAVPEDDPRVLSGAPLSARQSLSRSVGVVLSFGVAGALALVFLAFRVARPGHAVMAHALALIAGLFLVGGAARVALDRVPRTLPSRAERIGYGATTLAVLLVLLGLGALYLALGR